MTRPRSTRADDFRPFRQHDAVRSLPDGIYGQLVADWLHIHALTASATAIRRWARRHPALAGLARPGDVVDAIDAADPDAKDVLLLALISEFQRGQQLAGRIVLQAMLPKLLRIARSTASSVSWEEDRRHITIAAMWEVLAAYPIARRSSRVAANVALDTLHQVTRRPGQIEPMPVDPVELARGFTVSKALDHWSSPITDELSADGDLQQMLNWALTHQIITRADAHLLAISYPAAGRRAQFDVAARQLGISQEAVRQRCHRVRTRLADAVHSHLATA